MEPSRERDALVHKALWPDVEIHWMPPEMWGDPPGPPEPRYKWYSSWSHVEEPIFTLVPAYTTDLMAWDWEREGWEWQIEENYHDVMATLFSDPTSEAVIAYWPHGNSNRYRAQAMARSECVLKWKERGE